MESIPPAEQLRVIARGEAAPYVHFPPTPRWYFPAAGVWAGALVGSFSYRTHIALFAGTLVTLIALEVLLVAWQKRRHGALPLPGYGRPPAEIVSVWRGYVAGMVVIAGAVALAWRLGGIPAGAVTAFATVTAGLVLYERRYARAAARVTERLR
jgi:hypothetical protein